MMMIGHASFLESPLLLKTEQMQPGRPQIDIRTKDETEDEDDDIWFVCRHCRQKLTRPGHRTTVNGSHTHAFANPSGIVYEIACFSTAQGYSFMGSASTEFAWFAGHSWRIIMCSACLTHLGWYFSAMSGGGFFALITDRIELQSAPQP
jgi:hypothetical protein